MIGEREIMIDDSDEWGVARDTDSFGRLLPSASVPGAARSVETEPSNTEPSTNGHDSSEAEAVVAEAVAEKVVAEKVDTSEPEASEVNGSETVDPTESDAAVPVKRGGFLGGGPIARKYTTKSVVLAAVAKGRGRAWVGWIVRETGLSRGQVNGVLMGSLHAKDPFIERSRERHGLAPDGSAYFFRLNRRGLMFVRWAEKAGLVYLGSDGENMEAEAQVFSPDWYGDLISF